MVLAQLRGQLESYYPHGLRSVMRENMLLQALDMERTAQLGIQRLTIDAAYSAAYSAEGARAVLQNIQDSWRRYRQLSEFNTALQTKQKALDRPGAVLAKMHAAFEKAGVLEQIRQRDINLEKELTGDRST